MSEMDFETSLKACIDKNDEISSKLEELKNEMNGYHMTCNTVKTAGTVVSTAGTSILVASVLAAPFTGGLSLLGTGGGLAMSVGGGVTSVITEVVDSYKTEEIIKLIRELIESKQNHNNCLQKHFDSIRDLEKELVSNDISHEEALFSILRGIANESIDRLDTEVLSPTVRLLTTLSRLSHAEELLLKTTDFGIKGLHIVAPNALSVLSGLTGKFGANTAKLAGRVSLVFSFATTVVDIALLVSDWTSNHPTIKVIDEVYEKIGEENKSLIEIHSLMDGLKERVHYTIVDRVPIVGTTDIFNAVALHLLNNETYECRHLLKNNYEIEYSFKDLQTPENMALFLTKDTGAAVNFDKDQVEALIKKRGKGGGRSVRDLVKNLLKNLKDYVKSGADNKKRSSRGERVMNGGLTSICPQIIEDFVQQTYNCSFTEMTKIPSESSVYQDFHNPFSQEILHNIQESIVATIPGDVWYINSNAIIYEFLISILRESSKLHMVSLFNTDDICTAGTEHSTKVKSTIYLLNQFRIYVDEYALQYWMTHNGGNRATLEESRASVQAMLLNLNERMMTWVTQIKRYYPNRLYPQL